MLAALSFSSPPSVSLSLSLSITPSYYFNKHLKYDSKISGALRNFRSSFLSSPPLSLSLSDPYLCPAIAFHWRRIRFVRSRLPVFRSGFLSFSFYFCASDLLLLFLFVQISMWIQLMLVILPVLSCYFYMYWLFWNMGIEFVCLFGSIKESRRFYDVL